MKNLKRVLPLLLVVLMFFTTGSTVVSATKVKSLIYDDTLLKLTLDGKAVKIKGYEVEWKDTYYPVKEVAKILKGTNKKFNFKYNSSKQTITFYPGKSYNSKDVGVKILNTGEEKKYLSIDGDGEGSFFDRDFKVYVNNKKVSVNALLFKNTFYMKIEDIAKVANFGVSYDKYRENADISVKRKYSGIEEWTPDLADLSKITTKVKLGKEGIANIEDPTGIIKPMFKDAKFIESPKTTKDFDQLIKYMIWKGFTTCTIETNIPYYDVYQDGRELLSNLYDVNLLDNGKFELVKDFTVSDKERNEKKDIIITLVGHENENAKPLATKLKKYNEGIIKVLQELIAEGKLTTSLTEREKAEVLVQWVYNNVNYATEEYDANNISRERYTGSGALFDRLAVCEGYTKLYITLCHSVGLYDTYYIAGTTSNTPEGGAGHAWVGQILDGKRVMTDPTWYSEYNGVQAYFALSIKEMQKDHFYDAKKYPDWK